jgi:hypothetical protein
VRPEQRPQTVADFRERLGLRDSVSDDPRPSEERVKPKPSRKLIVAGALGGVGVLVAAAAFMFAGRDTAPEPRPGESVQAQAPKLAPPISPPAPAAAPAPAPAPNISVNPPTQAERQPPAPPPSQPAAEPGRPFSPADAIAQVFELRDVSHGVAVTLEKTTVRVGKDKLRFQVKSDRAGYLYILMLGTDKQHINLLFPNSLDQKNQAKGNQVINLPRPGWAMTAGGPPGTNEFIALVSEQPRDFKKIGLTKVGPFAEFSMDNVAAMSRSSSSAVLAGTPVCAAGAPCSAAYGAARFTIEEVN